MPVLYGTSAVIETMQNNFKVLTFWKSGEERIKNLELKNAELAILANKSSDLARENELLKKQQNISVAENIPKLEVNVLEIPGQMVVDAGSNSGVKTGQVVFYLDILVGTVFKVFPNRSFVHLVTNPNSQFTVRVGNVRGVAVGQFNNNLILDKVAQTEMVLPNDPVFTTGEGEAGIANLFVGNLGAVKSKDSDLFKKVEIVLPVDLKKLDRVFIGLL